MVTKWVAYDVLDHLSSWLIVSRRRMERHSAPTRYVPRISALDVYQPKSIISYRESGRSTPYPIATFHTRMLSSRLALMMKSSPGMKRTFEMEWSCPASVFVFFHSFCVSQIFINKSRAHETRICVSSYHTQKETGTPHLTTHPSNQNPHSPPPSYGPSTSSQTRPSPNPKS